MEVKVSYYFSKAACCNVSTLSIVVCGELVEMSDTAVHLGHTKKLYFFKNVRNKYYMLYITSNDRDNNYH